MARQLDFGAIELLYAEVAALSQAEDAPHTSGQMGIMALGVTKALGPTSLSDEGDYTPFQFDASGQLFTTISGMGFGSPADGAANPSTMQQVNAFPMIWNGTTWDRPRSVPTTDDIGATGIAAAGMLAFDGATWDRVRSVAPSDTLSNPVSSVNSASYSLVWDETNSRWTRAKATAVVSAGGIAAVDGVFPGLAAVGLHGQDTTTGNAIPSSAMQVGGSFAGNEKGIIVNSVPNLQNDSAFFEPIAAAAKCDAVNHRALGVGLLSFDGTVDRRTRVASADNLAGNQLPASGTYVFDGSTWDRWTGAVSSTPVLTALTVSETPEVSVGASDTTLKAANGSRKKVRIQNHGTGFVRVSESATATLTSPIRLVPQVGEYWVEPTATGHIYQGEISAISESGTNLVGVTEYT